MLTYAEPWIIMLVTVNKNMYCPKHTLGCAWVEVRTSTQGEVINGTHNIFVFSLYAEM